MGNPVTPILTFLAGIGVVGLVLVYLLFMPEKAEKVAGWVSGIVAKVFRKVDRTAVAFKVQGAINSMRSELLKNAPDLIEKKLRIRWADVDEAEARLRDGECLVVMRRSENHEENMAHAVMAYLPKALLSRARPYLDKDRMRAADLVVAKALLSHDESPIGALPIFYEKHLDPARAESADLKTKIGELDELDLNGWLSRVLLAEYQVLGDALHPGEPDGFCVKDSEEFARWLHRLASRDPGDESSSLSYKGRYFRIAVIFVAQKDRFEREGLAPYRKRAKRCLYQEKFDAVYLMARDDNIAAVETLAEDLERDALVARTARYVYPLRQDFKKRKMNRDRAIIVCLRRRLAPGETPDDLSLDTSEDLADEGYEPTYEAGEIAAVGDANPPPSSGGEPGDAVAQIAPGVRIATSVALLGVS